MTIKLTSLKADLDREEQGDWIDIPDCPGLRLQVRSIESPSYVIPRDQLVQKWVRKYGRKPIPRDVRSQGLGRLYAEQILLGWEGLEEQYSRERALEVLTDPAYRVFLGYVEYAAAQLAEIDMEFVDEAIKN